MLRNTFIIVRFLANIKKPIWFLNMESTVEKYVKFSAKKCGEFFSSKDWTRGFLTNIDK